LGTSQDNQQQEQKGVSHALPWTDGTISVLISLTLTLGLGLRKADAGACKAIGRSQGCVTAADVRDDSLRANDLKDEPGADFADGNQFLVLTTTATIARSVTVTAPRIGVVVVNVSGYFGFANEAGTGRCEITTGTALEFTHLIIAQVAASGIAYVPFAGTRAFEVPKGSTTFNCVCDKFSGNNVTIGDTSMTAIYVPTRY
jgi:hypothetical protein